jgi:hypothetical protein
MAWVNKTARSLVSLYRDSPERQVAGHHLQQLAKEEKDNGAEYMRQTRETMGGKHCIGCDRL